MQEKEAVYKVRCSVNLGGMKIRANDITITNGMNSIPTLTAVLPLHQSDAGTVIYASSDQSKAASVYDACKDAEENGESISAAIVSETIGDDAGSAASLSVSGWKVTGVALQPQNRTSPGGVVVTAMHPMCELLDTPGFFYAPGADYEKLLDDKESSNIVEAADNMLDVIFDVIDSSDYTKMKLGVTEDYDAVKKGANIRLGKWVECDGAAAAWPFAGSVGDAVSADDYAKACSTAFALNFAELPQSVPYNALLSLCGQLGLYIAPSLKGTEKAKIKVLDPWSREDVSDIDDKYVYSTQITRDTDPVIGVRFFESPADSMIVSTLSGAKPIDDELKTAGGEILYYFHGKKGRIINSSIPSFVRQVFSKLYKIVSAKTTSTALSGSGDDSTRASNTEWQDPKQQLKSIGVSTADALSILDALQAATAKTMFICLHRKTQRASVTLPFVTNMFPDIGSYIKIEAGSAKENPTGMVTSVIIRASCQQGLCTTTINASYCGPIAEDSSGNKLVNGMWSKD